MPHHDLQYLFGYTMPKSHRADECVAGNVCGYGEKAAESQTYAFKELVAFLIGDYLHFEVVAPQDFPCDRHNGRNKLVPGLYAISVNLVQTI